MKTNKVDDIFKKNLADYGSDFNLEQGWTDLAPRLEKKRRRRFIFIILALGLIITAGVTWLWPEQNTNTIDDETAILYQGLENINDPDPQYLDSSPEHNQNITIYNQREEIEKNRPPRQSDDAPQIEKSKTRAVAVVLKEVSESYPAPAQNYYESDGSSPSDARGASSNQSTQEMPPLPDLSPRHNDKTGHTAYASTDIAQDKSGSSAVLSSSDKDKSSTYLHKLPIIKTILKLEKTSTPILPGLPLVATDIDQQDQQDRPKWAVSIEGGGGLYSHNYNYKIEDEEIIPPSSFIEALESISGAAKLHMQVTDQWTISAGLEYQKTTERFSYSESQLISRQTEGVQTILYNPVTGDSTFVRGPVTQMGTQLRQVNHYNTFTNWNMLLGANYKLNFSKLSINPGLGMAVNISSQKKGKELYLDEIVDSEIAALYKSKVGLAIYIETQIAYQISPDLHVTVSPNIRKSISNWSAQDDVTLKPLFYNLQLGVKKSF